MKPSENEIWLTVGGWYEDAHCDALYELVRALSEDAAVVELGPFNGKSGLAMGLACPGTDRCVWLVDDFRQDDCRAVLQENITKLGLQDHCFVIEGVSWEVGATWGRPVHLLHVDAGHEEEEVERDIQAWLPHVVKGGIIVVHDFDVTAKPGPTVVARRLLGEPTEIWSGVEEDDPSVAVYYVD